MPRAVTGRSEDAFIEPWDIDDAGQRTAFMLDGDHRAIQRHAADERLGAVDRIENPPEARSAGSLAKLLAQNAVFRKRGGDALAEKLLRRTVGNSHGGGV